VLIGTASTWFLLDIAFYSQNLFLPNILEGIGYNPPVSLPASKCVKAGNTCPHYNTAVKALFSSACLRPLSACISYICNKVLRMRICRNMQACLPCGMGDCLAVIVLSCSITLIRDPGGNKCASGYLAAK
jgi:hypothetical protein